MTNKLTDTIALFCEAEPSFRLEILLDYAGRLPVLPEVYVPLRDAGINMVHECQSPVFMMVDVVEGCTRIVADVPREAPTARGFVSLLIDLFDGRPATDVVQAPPDLLGALGLSSLIGMQRTRGLSAIYYRLRRDVSKRLEETPA